MSATADQDLDDQAAWLASQRGLETTLRFHDATGSKLAELADTPGIGERGSSAYLRLAGLRVWRIEPFE